MDTGDVHESKLLVHNELRRDGELLTRVELDIACASEKLLNLNALMMNVATREGEFEGFASDKEDLLPEPIEKALEFDLLCRILDLEVREVQKFMTGLQTETGRARELISACKSFGQSFSLMEEKLLFSEESLKQLQEQVLDISTQSATFRRTLVCFDGEDNLDFSEDKELLMTDTRIKMQTAEQQRDILMMLAKSLAREMDLEKKLTESRQVEEELKQKLLSYENELCFTEEEACNVWEKLFEADNVSEALMGISKELLGRFHILQFNLNGSLKREDEMKSKFEFADKQLKSQECTLKRLESGETRLNDFFVAQTESLKASLSETEEKLILISSEAFTLREKVSSLENQLKCSEFQQLNVKVPSEGSPKDETDLHFQIGETRLNDFFVGQTESLKASLSETEEKLILISSEAFTLREKVNSLENQLKCSEFQQLNVKVSSEGSPKDENDLHFQISELENVIEDLKENLSKAENRAESAEARCNLLAETNMELNDEVCLLKGSGSAYEKVESLEASLEASQEKHGMLCSTISDMEKLIEDLKLKASKAENIADSAEDKCIELSESHAALNEKVELLEGQLQKSDIQLQHAVASLEACLEKQSMLYSTIGDMENLIEDLKSKASKAESRADSAEDKCIILSESHADLNEEVNFLRGRSECLEAALHQAEGTKLATAKDIGIRTKVITNLVMQLAIERERLHKQISSLAKENKILVVKLQQKKESSSPYMSQDRKESGKDSRFCKHDRTFCTKDGEGEVTDVFTTSHEMDRSGENIHVHDTEMEPLEASEIETVRRIDAAALNTRHVIMAIFILLVSAAAVYVFQQSSCPF